MITLVLTNRNRDLRIVKNCFDSLKNQTNTDFEWVVVDYGSDESYLHDLQKLVGCYPKIHFIGCPVQGQLWNKCRAINIALKKTNTPYFLVGDIDLIFHPHFIQIAKELAKPNQGHYFQYGFLAKEESLLDKNFEDFIVDFKGNSEVTGTTLFPTEVLKKCKGYDEFYHGWGAEDTDIHIRMKSQGLSVHFYEDAILLKHQWHPKAYRSKWSSHPFHSFLERINHAYMLQTEQSQRTIVNQNQDWGQLPLQSEYQMLDFPNYTFDLKATTLQLSAVLAQLQNFKEVVVRISISDFSTKEKLKNCLKKAMGKKNIPMVDLETVNNLLLEEMIKNYRNCPYQYAFDRQQQQIVVTIKL